MHNVNLHFWKEKIQPKLSFAHWNPGGQEKKVMNPLNFRGGKKKTTSAKKSGKKNTKNAMEQKPPCFTNKITQRGNPPPTGEKAQKWRSIQPAPQ